MSETGAPETFGNVTAEYLALRNEAAVVRGHSAVVWVDGPDAVSFLDGLLSQDVGGLASGGVGRGFLLDPRGKLQALLWILRGDERVGLVTDAGSAASVVAGLERFRFRVDASVSMEPGAVVDLWGPQGAGVVAGAGFSAGAGWSDDPGGLVAELRLGALPRHVLTGDVAATIGAETSPAGTLASTAVRIEAGEPVMGVDVDTATIPQETGLVAAAVSFTKGCYLGQELVARIDSRGHVNRRLCGVVMRENLLPPPGAAIMGPNGAAGSITSVAESLTLRAPVGLGMVRSEIEAGSVVSLQWEGGAVAAEIRDLPLDTFSAA